MRIQTCAGVYQAEGSDKDVFGCKMQWLCGWSALKIRGAISHQEISGTIQSPPGNDRKVQDYWRWRKLFVPKLSPSKLFPDNPPPPSLYCDFFF